MLFIKILTAELSKTMKSDMENYPYFAPGMVISCTTCLEQVIEGEVIGYDYEENLISISILFV